jgi:hypothetical protein
MTSDMELEMPNNGNYIKLGLRSTFQRCYGTRNTMHHEGRLALVKEGL